ncbi:MAG: guanylate kinase [Peptococcaceae bacterium]|nr:guanylate kinase [Peptococcaceae bacterium]
MDKGLLVVVSGPSGVGKGTICNALREKYPELVYSVSATTRPMREGEVEGVNYFFLSKEDFLAKIEAGAFLEWAEVYGNFYGTPKWIIDAQLAAGNHVLLEIDMQGAVQVKKAYPESVLVFILPPSEEELAKRLSGRGTDSADVIAKRLACWQQEKEMLKHYDYAVVNDTVSQAVERVSHIITAEECSVERM